MSVEESVKALRKSIKRTGRVDEGTVIRFKYWGYTYAALYVAGRWYLTGNGSLIEKAYTDYERFMGILASEHAENVEIVTGYASI